ncbi:hypothetical protein IMSAGC013_04818 [Lachnospiraceae bacterium]|nr:hypothetical protein IMSAGC013_04818 [Lachnospiraceae bacterium]
MLDHTGVMPDIMAQDTDAFFGLLHQVVLILQTFDIRFKEHVFPVDVLSFRVAFHIPEHHNVRYGHGDHQAQDSENIAGIFLKRMREKGKAGKTAVKERRDQA